MFSEKNIEEHIEKLKQHHHKKCRKYFFDKEMQGNGRGNQYCIWIMLL